MTDLQRHYRQRCIAKTVRRHNALFVGRAFAVPAFTNDVSPAASTLSLLGQRGEGETGRDAVSPASSDVSNLLHGSLYDR